MKSPITEAIDYSTINSVDDFRRASNGANLIFAVDKHSQAEECVFGRSTLRKIMKTGKARRLAIVAFAVDFQTTEVEHLLASVLTVRGHSEWNEKVYTTARAISKGA